MDTSTPFKWRHFEAEIILLCVRWYLRYSLSYRDLEEMMRERGLSVDHSTISRWVQCYAPEIDKRSRPGSGSLEQDDSLGIVAMEEEEQARLMHNHRLGKGQCHAHKTGQTLP